MADQVITHDQRNITINISLSAPPATVRSLQDSLYILDDASALPGTVEIVSDMNEVDALVGGSGITQAAADLIEKFFSQSPRPERLKLAALITADSDNYATGLGRIRAVDDSFYALGIESRAGANLEVASAAVEALPEKLLFVQSGDADLLTTGLPTAIANLNTRERTVGVYHDSATQGLDLAYMAAGFGIDPDVRSSPWGLPLNSINAYASALNTTQVNALEDNHFNFGLPYSSELFSMEPGVNTKNRPIYEMVTRDWFAIRLRERVAQYRVDKALAREKIILDITGQGELLGELLAQLEAGVTAEHFVPGSIDAEPLDILTSDISLQKLRFKASAKFATDARKFEFNVNLSR